MALAVERNSAAPHAHWWFVFCALQAQAVGKRLAASTNDLDRLKTDAAVSLVTFLLTRMAALQSLVAGLVAFWDGVGTGSSCFNSQLG